MAISNPQEARLARFGFRFGRGGVHLARSMMLADYLQETHVHKLGNLTISGFNSTLGNKTFKDKRDRKDSKGRPVGYRNGLKLNADLAAVESWSIDQIDARTKKLADEAMRLFSLSAGAT